MALADGIVTKSTRVLDYGCGHGDDLKYLKSRKIKASGWDPHHRPGGKIAPASVVNLGYVLNVIEDPRERSSALKRAYELAEQALVVSVRVDKVPDTFTEYGDGYLTARDTFQKIYTQSEFREYVEKVAGGRAHVASLGIAYVFKDDDLEARYLASRAFTRRLEYRTDLIEEFGRNVVAKRLVRQAQKLGRVPHDEEFKGYAKLEETFGSRQRIERLLLRAIDPTAFEGSREQRREDILTYLAMVRLQGLKPPRFTALEPAVQRDVKAIWASYARTREEAEAFLFSLGSPDTVRATAKASPVGKLLPEDLYLHRSGEDELPALLRVLLFAARRIVGDFDYDIVKIALDGRAVSFLSYPSFDEVAHPALERSLRVYLPRASYSIREYGSSTNPAILHRKDAMVSPAYPLHAEFQALTEAEQALGLLAAPGIGRRADWEELLASRGVRVDGHRVVPR